MATSEEVKKLAALARIEVGEAELEKFAKEFDGILAYVGQLDALTITHESGKRPQVRNVFRHDAHPHEAAAHTKALTDAFPERDGDYLKVKQIISYE